MDLFEYENSLQWACFHIQEKCETCGGNICLEKEGGEEPVQHHQCAHLGGLVCAPCFLSGISRNRSDSDQNLIGNSGTQYHPNSREFAQFVRPDFQSERSVPIGPLRTESDQFLVGTSWFRPVPIGKTARTVINH